MFENGIGSSQDHIESVLHYEQSAKTSSIGCACYGWCLRSGIGIPIDVTSAAEFFHDAADCRNADGANNFAVCLEGGEGVTADIGKAVSYYRKAVARFHIDGLYNFWRCLEYGKGVRRSPFGLCNTIALRRSWAMRQRKTVLGFALSLALRSKQICL
jgi:TPR repeat protein